MSVSGRSARLLLNVALTVLIIVTAYLTVLVRRLMPLPRLLLIALLGAPVVGSVYLDEARRRAPEGLRSLPTSRVSPLKAAAVVGLAVTLLATSAPIAPVSAAKPSEAVVQAARSYLGTPYRLGATGLARFDCSGLIFRIFSDVGELPRIGGKRMRAARYLGWFSARGMVSKTKGTRGDLVVWGGGKHIGVYLGKGKVISALLDRGVTVHGLHSIGMEFTTFLNVSWKGDMGAGGRARDVDDEDKGKKKKNRRDRDRDSEAGAEAEPQGRSDAEELADGEMRGLATGTMNLRRGPGPAERVTGWVRKGSRFTVTGTGHSPSGALWYSVELRNGKSGWVFSRWVRTLDD
jgi:cell wall-associated NlpC family hydrolase